MRCFGRDDKRRRADGSLQGLLHLLNGVRWNPLVASAVQTENRSLHPLCHVQGMCGLQFSRLTDEPTVPGDAGLYLGIVGGIQPDNPSSPTESGDPELLDISVARSLDPRYGCVKIGHHLRIRNFGDDLADIVNLAEAGHVALPRIELGSHREIARFGQTTADVLDVLMDAENFLHDQYRRK